jgi:hypothetical protein
MSASPHFTAARIAEVLGKSARVVRRWLSVITPDGEMMVRGNLASAWKVESLPAHVIQELTATANAKGFRSIDNLLSDRCDAWQPEIPWNEICSDQQAEAITLQRALLPMIQRRNEAGLAVADFEALGVQAYQRETGREITRERWGYIFNRTIQRDAGAGQFHRPELFLNGNLRKALPAKSIGDNDSDFEPLNLCVAGFHNQTEPSGEEIDALWIEAVELFLELRENEKPKKLKRRLLDFLSCRAPFLAANPNALRVNFDRKLKAFEASKGDETALLDGRELKRGEKRAPEFPQDDIDRIAWHSARNCGDRTTQAVRELASAGERSGLSALTLDTITRPAKSKSYVNRRLFSTVHPEVKAIAPFLLGKKAKDDATPALQRDYSKLHSMDVLTADDFTMPVYMFVPDGKGWWILTRGQCLLMIDVRSLKIIEFSLQPERSYNSLVIRTLMNHTCRAWGLPRAWYFENGIWRNAHLVKGPPREWSEGKSWGEIKPGWARLGVKFIHAKKARSKPAELVGGLLQNLMERMPGYCGRDERRDCPEETKKNKLAVEARRIEPHGLFLSFDAWYSELERLVNVYNNNIQDGRILRGLSPEQAFESFWPVGNEPVKFDASCWHLLAHYVSERAVGVDGISFKIGNQLYNYRDENSSSLRGRSVLAWFDPEYPDLLGVTDKHGRDPRLIQRSKAVDFLACMDRDGQSGKEFHDELAKVAGHNSYPKARYKVLYCKFNPTFRKNLVAPGVANVAETFEAGRKDIQEREQQKTERASTRIKRARKVGLQPAAVRGDLMGDKGLDMMQRALAAEEKKSKTYVLDPHKTFTPKNNGGNQ